MVQPFRSGLISLDMVANQVRMVSQMHKDGIQMVDDRRRGYDGHTTTSMKGILQHIASSSLIESQCRNNPGHRCLPLLFRRVSRISYGLPAPS